MAERLRTGRTAIEYDHAGCSMLRVCRTEFAVAFAVDVDADADTLAVFAVGAAQAGIDPD